MIAHDLIGYEHPVIPGLVPGLHLTHWWWFKKQGNGYDTSEIDEDTVRKNLPPYVNRYSPGLLVMNIEAWSLSEDFGQVAYAIEQLRRAARWAQDIAGRKLGFYRLLPTTNDNNHWQRRNDFVWDNLAEYVGYLCPSIYLKPNQSIDEWKDYAGKQLDEADRITCGSRPIYPFINPRQYPFGNRPLLDYETFKAMLEFCHERDCRPVIFDSGNGPWTGEDSQKALVDFAADWEPKPSRNFTAGITIKNCTIKPLEEQ